MLFRSGLWQWYYVTISRWKESPAALETLMAEARFEKMDPPHNSSWQVIGMPHKDDGPPLFLSAAIFLFGSWMGSGNGNGAT